ncbi:hypothetical protein BE221DRAFT_74443 [Ostreococcus tauri]|uniref:Uncharacterized protein n=1 Tax=Ostreococcus tauri TaxID=70448 RepID=A0A1Y5IHJ1_OSTTA|nr:hypothetical protein BE221DRAFT_74443 [Ostreococcus tauri]
MNPIPFVASSAPNASSPTSRRARATRDVDPDVAVLDYWERVRRGTERAPRPGAEARANKRRCAHLESRIGDVLGWGGASRDFDGGEADADEDALAVGEKLTETDVERLKARAREEVGTTLDATEVERLKSFGETRRSDSGPRTTFVEESYSMPLAPESEPFDDGGTVADEFFEYGRDELPRHLRDWYAPPAQEYGSFVADSKPAAGAYNWRSDENRYTTVRNLRSHGLW